MSRPTHSRTTVSFLLVVFSFLIARGASAEDAGPIEELVVRDVAPLRGADLDRDLLASNPQLATGREIMATQTVGIAGFMEERLGGVALGEAQGNPLQPDVLYRGYVASPLLGVPQGLAVYQNGVRLNDPFGDTVNWDLIPEIAVGDLELVPGADPLFGLNALGGAIAIRTKDGFSHSGTGGRVLGGSFGRVALDAETGGNDGEFGYYLAVHFLDESGWRDHSPSSAVNVFGSLGWRGEASALDLDVSFADTDLTGNGPAPVQLLAIDRDAIFTFPDTTKNQLQSYALEGQHSFSDRWSLTALGFYRGLRTTTFNGDSTEFVDCELPSHQGLLCEEEGVGTPEEEVVVDQTGRPAGVDLDAVNNRTSTDQGSFGGGLQTRFDHEVFGASGTLLGGVGYDGGRVDFASSVELAELTAARGTMQTGRFVPRDAVSLRADRDAWSAYATEILSFTDDLTLNVGARLVSTSIDLRDTSGLAPDLNGSHDYFRINPVVGLRYRALPELTVFAAYRESSRTPSPVELACADPTAPCNLPNAFLADPPLDQVVARTGEIGLRGSFSRYVSRWSLSAFWSQNADDILFVSTGGVTSNEGFFDNVGTTDRQGVELGLAGDFAAANLQWRLDYSYLRATFGDTFVASSPNHPDADAGGDIVVQDGDRIPGLPEHILKAGIDWTPLPELRLGANLRFYSDRFLRGDEANLLDPIDGYALVGITGEWQAWKNVSILARVENLLNSDYETFGLLGDPEEVLGPEFDDPRFLSPGAPIGGWVGVRVGF